MKTKKMIAFRHTIVIVAVFLILVTKVVEGLMNYKEVHFDVNNHSNNATTVAIRLDTRSLESGTARISLINPKESFFLTFKQETRANLSLTSILSPPNPSQTFTSLQLWGSEYSLDLKKALEEGACVQPDEYTSYCKFRLDFEGGHSIYFFIEFHHFFLLYGKIYGEALSNKATTTEDQISEEISLTFNEIRSKYLNVSWVGEQKFLSRERTFAWETDAATRNSTFGEQNPVMFVFQCEKSTIVKSFEKNETTVDLGDLGLDFGESQMCNTSLLMKGESASAMFLVPFSNQLKIEASMSLALFIVLLVVGILVLAIVTGLLIVKCIKNKKDRFQTNTHETLQLSLGVRQ